MTQLFRTLRGDDLRPAGDTQHWNCQQHSAPSASGLQNYATYIFTRDKVGIELPREWDRLGQYAPCRTCPFQIKCLNLSNYTFKRELVPNHALNLKALKRGGNPHKRGGGP